MRRRPGVATAVVVLLGGGALSLLFHKPPETAIDDAAREHEVSRHRTADEGPRYLMEVRSAPAAVEKVEPVAPPAAPVPREAPADRIGGLPRFEAGDTSLPRFANRYEDQPRAIPPTRHEVVDGDTLQSLAARYLGSANRAAEIFAANRDVLTNPDLLPIGMHLKLPLP